MGYVNGVYVRLFHISIYLERERGALGENHSNGKKKKGLLYPLIEN